MYLCGRRPYSVRKGYKRTSNLVIGIGRRNDHLFALKSLSITQIVSTLEEL